MSLFCWDDERSLTSRHELSHGTATELSPGFSEVEGHEIVSEADLDERVDGECVAAACVGCLSDTCVSTLVADVHCVVWIVWTTEFVWETFVALVGQNVCGTALVLKVVSEEAETAPCFLVQVHGEVPARETSICVCGCKSTCETGCSCEHGCSLGSTEVVFKGSRELLVGLDTVDCGLGCNVLYDVESCLYLVACADFCSTLVLVVDVIDVVVHVVVEDIISVCSCCILCEPDTTGHVGSEPDPVSYTHLRAHETDSYLVCRLLLEKKKKNN